MLVVTRAGTKADWMGPVKADSKAGTRVDSMAGSMVAAMDGRLEYMWVVWLVAGKAASRDD